MKGFSSATYAEMAKSKVLEKANEIANQLNGSSQTSGPTEEHEEVRKKKRKESSLWEEFDKDDLDHPITLSQGERELEQYLGISRLPHSEDPLKFWKSHGIHFPHLTPLSKRVLAILPTSADSEHVFSCAGNIVSPTRSCLDPEKVKMLVFLNKNRDHI